jgi:hypothetical protein
LLVWFTNHLEVKPFEMGGQVVKDKHGDEKLELTSARRTWDPLWLQGRDAKHTHPRYAYRS